MPTPEIPKTQAEIKSIASELADGVSKQLQELSKNFENLRNSASEAYNKSEISKKFGELRTRIDEGTKYIQDHPITAEVREQYAQIQKQFDELSARINSHVDTEGVTTHISNAWESVSKFVTDNPTASTMVVSGAAVSAGTEFTSMVTNDPWHTIWNPFRTVWRLTSAAFRGALLGVIPAAVTYGLSHLPPSVTGFLSRNIRPYLPSWVQGYLLPQTPLTPEQTKHMEEFEKNKLVTDAAVVASFNLADTNSGLVKASQQALTLVRAEITNIEVLRKSLPEDRGPMLNERLVALRSQQQAIEKRLPQEAPVKTAVENNQVATKATEAPRKQEQGQAGTKASEAPRKLEVEQKGKEGVLKAQEAAPSNQGISLNDPSLLRGQSGETPNLLDIDKSITIGNFTVNVEREEPFALRINGRRFIIEDDFIGQINLLQIASTAERVRVGDQFFLRIHGDLNRLPGVAGTATRTAARVAFRPMEDTIFIAENDITSLLQSIQNSRSVTVSKYTQTEQTVRTSLFNSTALPPDAEGNNIRLWRLSDSFSVREL